MDPIPVHRAAHLFSFVEFLHSIGAPVDRRLESARLPTMPGDRHDALVPLLRSQIFVNAMGRTEGIDDLALRAKDFTTIKRLLDPAVVGRICSAPTLKTALEASFKLAKREISHLDCWMVLDRDTVRICQSYRIPFDDQGLQHFELGTNTNLLRIVQLFAGPGWIPKTMAFRSTIAPGRYAAERFPDTRFLTGRKFGWIDMPRSMLSLPGAGSMANESRTDRHSPPNSSAAPAADFASFLKQVLLAYLGDGHLPVQLAAEIAGTSVRTMQRQLAESGVTYSELVQQARFEAASRLLLDPGNKVIDVAQEVGYDDPAHFARAFRRIAGVSPREYRIAVVQGRAALPRSSEPGLHAGHHESKHPLEVRDQHLRHLVLPH